MQAVIYYTEISEKYQNKNMEHMYGEKLLETAIFQEYGLNIAHEPRAAGEYGKPFFTLRPSIHYNISHSGKYVVCMLAEQAVGIDIQIHKELYNFERMLRRIVPEAMAEEMLQSEDWKEKFFEQWVLREAYVKWTGEGLRIDMRTIEMEKGWHKLLPFQESYSCAVWSAKEMEIVWKKAEIELI